MKKQKKIRTAKGRICLSCAAALCMGVTAVIWADGIVPQTEVYDGLANTAFSSEYMSRADYHGSVTSVGTCDVAALSIGAGVAEACSSSSALVTLFSRYAQASAARPLDARRFFGFSLSIR